jgi:hypothetical protein
MTQLDQLAEPFVQELWAQVQKRVVEQIELKLKQLDITTLVQKQIESMAHELVNNNNIISGNNIVGGIIKQFGSTGIQDSATTCQMTILDEATVIENKLVTNDLEVKGSVIIDGDIILKGEIPADSPFFRDVVEHAAGIVHLALKDAVPKKPRKSTNGPDRQ